MYTCIRESGIFNQPLKFSIKLKENDSHITINRENEVEDVQNVSIF